MDWKIDLKDKYPQLYYKFLEYLDNKSIATFNVHPRDLYDFFDANGLYIGLRYTKHKTRPFKFYINGKWVKYPGFPNRTEAEVAAFNVAFEILNG